MINYVENFTSRSASVCPPGLWLAKAAWIPCRTVRCQNPRITGGLADVDTDGDGVADTGLGITEERQTWRRYAAGQTLWRTPLLTSALLTATGASAR